MFVTSSSSYIFVLVSGKTLVIITIIERLTETVVGVHEWTFQLPHFANECCPEEDVNVGTYNCAQSLMLSNHIVLLAFLVFTLLVVFR